MNAYARLVLGVGMACFAAALGAAPASASTANAGAFSLTATKVDRRYAPTFTGNGLLGVRVPPAGQGYAGGTVPAQAELAGFYAKPSRGAASKRVQQRANIPNWDALSFADRGVTFAPFKRGHTSNWRQTINLHTGVITTTARWTAPDGHVTDIAYEVFTDRARENVGAVQLTLRPQWTGTATVTDALDGTADRVTGSKLPPVLTRQASKGSNLAGRSDWLSIQALGTGLNAALADDLQTSANIVAPSTETDTAVRQSTGQKIAFPVTAGETYTLTKYAGIATGSTPAAAVAAARLQAASAGLSGLERLRAENDAAWAQLWQGRIDVAGNRTIATDVNASEFYLWSSTRSDQNWSISPAGLSSNGYDGHIFWDAETWMFPSLLAQHPDLAQAMESYRIARLPAAQRHATATGFTGARYPWESALNGTEQIPPPVSVNSEGLYEQHITADIALALWQYYETTHDTTWLRTQAWPVLRGAATFWASHAVRGTHGSYHLHHVTDPDEENPNVTDAVFTNVGAKTTLREAIAAAHVVGAAPPAAWAKIAAGLVVPVTDGIHPEFAGYGGQLVKQGDVTLLQYPWRFEMSRAVAQADLNFYVPRIDPGGPSMSDAVNQIDSLANGTPGCSAYAFVQRSYQPYIRDVFDQFSETKTGGAFTFMTGIGGFLQEFLYGWTSLRWEANDVRIAPSLEQGLSGVTVRRLQWRGRVFTVAVGPRTTTLDVLSGEPLPVVTPSGRRTVRTGHPLTMRTARPDLTHTSDRIRCQAATATSAEPGQPALAAVDGSPATDWQPTALPAALTVPTHYGNRTIDQAVIRWGHWWPQPPKPNVHPAPRPVQTVRATRYQLQVSTDNYRWETVATVRGGRSGSTDVLHFPAVLAPFVRLRMSSGGIGVVVSKKKERLAPMVQELTVS